MESAPSWRTPSDGFPSRLRTTSTTRRSSCGTIIGENRMPEYIQLVVSDPAIMMGKPVIAGTRITVELILDKLAAGESVQQILDSHPELTEDRVRAALAFAADVLRADAIYPLEPATR